MLRVLNLFCVVSLFVCTLKVQATRLKYPEFHNDVSRNEHYDDADEHNPEYDHEAFLGEKIAMEWEKLPDDVVKEKLRLVALNFYQSYLYCLRKFSDYVISYRWHASSITSTYRICEYIECIGLQTLFLPSHIKLTLVEKTSI